MGRPVVNSIPRDPVQKLSEIRSVFDFNAKGDSVTDDLQAFKNAIGSLPNLAYQTLGISTYVTLAGTTVNFSSGQQFDESLEGQTVALLVGSTLTKFVVETVEGPTALTLASPAGSDTTPQPMTYFANCGEIVIPEPPFVLGGGDATNGSYIVSGTLYVSPYVTLRGRGNFRTAIALQPNTANSAAWVVNVTGNIVTLVDGPPFPASLAGMRVIISGQPYDVYLWGGSTSLTLSTSSPEPIPNAPMAAETFVISILLGGDTRSGGVTPSSSYTEYSRVENLVIDGGYGDGDGGNPYSSGLYMPVSQLGGLQAVHVTECGQKGIYSGGASSFSGGAFCILDNIVVDSNGVGPGLDLWNCHDMIVTGLWAEFNNVNGALDGDGDYMADIRVQGCQNLKFGAIDSEGCPLPVKIAGSDNVVISTIFLNGNIARPELGIKITNLTYTGTGCNGIKILRAVANQCAVAIADNSYSKYLGGQARSVTIPGAPSWLGTVNVFDTAVTATAGDSFTQAMVGQYPGIDGAYGPIITAVADSTHLTLSYAPGDVTSADFKVAPYLTDIQYEQETYLTNLVGRTGTLLAFPDPADDAALSLGGQPLRFQGSSGGVNIIQGVPPRTSAFPIAFISNPLGGAVTITVPNAGPLFQTAQRVILSGIAGQLSLNGSQTITLVNQSANTFTVDGIAGDGAASSGGTMQQDTSFLLRSQYDDILIQGGQDDSSPRIITLRFGLTGPSIVIGNSGNLIDLTASNKVNVDTNFAVTGEYIQFSGMVGGTNYVLGIDGSGYLRAVVAATLVSLGVENTPVRTNGSGDLTTGQIDLGSSVDVKGTGLTSGAPLEWDGAEVANLSSTNLLNALSVAGGATGVFSDIASTSGSTTTVVTSVDFSTESTTATSLTAIESITEVSHDYTDGLITS